MDHGLEVFTPACDVRQYLKRVDSTRLLRTRYQAYVM
jgi:hypothetical protein